MGEMAWASAGAAVQVHRTGGVTRGSEQTTTGPFPGSHSLHPPRAYAIGGITAVISYTKKVTQKEVTLKKKKKTVTLNNTPAALRGRAVKNIHIRN